MRGFLHSAFLAGLSLTLLTAAPFGQAAGQADVTGRPGTAVPPTAPVVMPPAEPWIILPHVRPRVWPQQRQPVNLTAVAAKVDVVNQVATTTLELSLTNTAGFPQEAVVMVPVPDGAAVRSFQYDGTGPEPTAKLLAKDEARRIYESIVAREKDPALLEFAGYNVIRSSAFPIPANATQKVRVTYEHLLAADGARVDYVLPRSESLGASGIAWTISGHIKNDKPVTTAYCPSHDLATERVGAGEMTFRVAEASLRNPGTFRLCYLTEHAGDGLVSTLLAYPDPTLGGGKGGYFLLVAGLPPGEKSAKPKVLREVTLVIDRSGSMKGAKIEQAKAAALGVLEGLEQGEYFNVIDFSDSIASFKKEPVAKSPVTMAEARTYIGAIESNGGTNIKDAVLEALRPKPSAETLPLVLFLTDGLPTVGERNEVKIREVVKSSNSFNRRVFTFGVGLDVNTPLLTNIAKTSRAASTFVMPDENVEVAVSQVFRRLNGPTLAMPRLTAIGADGRPSTSVRELMPGELSDVFEGDQIVVLGQYTEGGTLKLKLEGDGGGKPRTFDLSFDLAQANNRNGFVPRLWAQRKIATLIDEIRQAGAEGTNGGMNEARMKELTDEIVRLSTRFGIMTEYTSFLADTPAVTQWRAAGGQGVAPAASAPMTVMEGRENAKKELDSKAVNLRSGSGAVSQEKNIAPMQTLGCVAGNTWYDDKMGRVTTNNVQSCNDQTFFNRGGRWVDARLLTLADKDPDKTVVFGTPEYAACMDEMAKQNLTGVATLDGEVYVLLNGQRVLIKPAV